MTDFMWDLFDTVVLGTTANVETILFQTPQGADATHTEQFTNMRGAGAFASAESFDVQSIHLVVDFHTAVVLDLVNWYLKSFFELRVADDTVCKAPAVVFSNYNFWSGHFAQAAAANEGFVGIQSAGYVLPNPYKIPPGVPFRGRYVQGTALSAASLQLKVILRGILHTV